MSDDQVSAEASTDQIMGGNTQTSDMEGQNTAENPLAPEGFYQEPETTDVESSIESMIPEEPEVEAEPAEEKPKTENKRSKDQRISQKDWQDMKEKANKAEALQETLQEFFGDKADDETPETDENLAKKAISMVSSLQAKVERVEYEKTNPIVNEERYSEEWARVNEDEKYSNLSFDERKKLVVSIDQSNLAEQLVEQVRRNDGSMPTATPSSSDTGKKVLDPETLKLWKNSGGTEASLKSAIDKGII